MAASPTSSSLALAALALCLACDREHVTHARVPKEAPEAAAQASPHPAMRKEAAAPEAGIPAPPATAPGGGLKWTLPEGWSESRTGGIRYATLTTPVRGKVDVSVVVLSGAAGGELANVNRWRGQIGLPPLDEASLAAQRRKVVTKAGPVAVFDFTSEGDVKSRVVAGLLSAPDGNTWFLKMVGDAAPVGQAKPDFLRLMETLRLD